VSAPSTEHAPVLEIDRLCSGYTGVPVIRDLDIVARRGQVVAILGPNGAGKTTLLKTIAGVLKPMTGEVRYDGARLTGRVHRRARRGIALVTEERAVIRCLTVKENLKLGTANVDSALEHFPQLVPLQNRKAGLLSGGEQQMLVLARMLANDARLMLVDELSFGLAPMIVEQLLRSLRAAADRGATVILVEQHPKQALSIADHAYVLNRGRVELSGSAEELRGRLHELEAAYLALVPEVAGARAGA
jgi:branched-chain amino acid transport system ATP-binding protein